MKNLLGVAEGSFKMDDIMYTLLPSDFEINESASVSLVYNREGKKNDVPLKRMGLQIHLSQVLSAAPRCRSLVAATALSALGIT